MERRIADRYRLIKRVLAGDSGRGIPELWEAHGVGDVYFAKIWTRNGYEDNAIQALWNREVRSLSRLQGYPGASELFVRLHDLGFNDQSYYAILDGGRRILLSTVLSNRSRYPWLLNLHEVGRRRPIWDGLLRIAEAVSVLHSEGTLHRSISSAAVFTSPDQPGEFRLSGFEWSLRVAGGGAAARVGQTYPVHAPELDDSAPEYSVLTDWFDFGLLLAEVFGIPVYSLRSRDSVRAAVEKMTQLRQGEREAILHFLAENTDARVGSGEAALTYLRNIIRELNIATTGVGRNLILAVRLGADREISKTIESVSESKAKAGDAVAQRNWIERDLRADVRIIGRAQPFAHYVLKGEKLEYRVRQWDVDGLRTWELGFCEGLERIPRSTSSDQYFSLGQRKLEIALYPDVRKFRQRLRDRAASWDRILPLRRTRFQLAPHLRDVHDFFRVTQQLETVLTAAQICPVDVLDFERSDTATEITVTPHEESDRNELAQSLRLPSPSEQLRDWFELGVEVISDEDDDDRTQDEYQLLDRRIVTAEIRSNLSWTFVAAEPHREGPRYVFRCTGSVPVRRGVSYLARNFGGTIAQIRRRYEAIEEMRTHEDLLRLLADPCGTTRIVVDTPPPERAHIPLDDSKLEALSKLWRMQPFFALQGPPGTGKTTLIEAFTDRLLARDQTAQLLITAHSHHTVDDVLRKLSDQFANISADKRPILVRIGARTPSAHDVAPITEQILNLLQRSSLARSAPEYLQQRLQNALRAPAYRDELADSDFRTMQLLAQDAANVTFSTCNSSELAELADRGRRFDWSVIEEAGKAHGFDMAAALQASHRLLLIGDHFQLPPFNAGVFKDLLADPLRIRKAMQLGVRFAPGLIDASIVADDEDDREPFEERCNRWRRMVDLFAVLFTASMAAEDPQNGPAATLTDQHRMHPTIATLVGKVFYPNDAGGTIINSPNETHEKFSGPPPFAVKPHSWLPTQRIVWRDVPWVQKKEYSIGESDGLFTAPTEALAVVDVLEQLRPTDRPCELQILSPYNDQLRLIRSEVERAMRAGRLGPLFRPPFDLMKDKRLGATVDEFQGSEADVVIVSLVRNNAIVPWKSIGFLKEANRMNVLLSRARHKLIIVGSWDFFSSRCTADTSPDDPYAYIGRMMTVMREERAAGRLAIHPLRS